MWVHTCTREFCHVFLPVSKFPSLSVRHTVLRSGGRIFTEGVSSSIYPPPVMQQ